MLEEPGLTISSDAPPARDNQYDTGRHWRVGALVILIAGTIVYLNSFHGQFVFDDAPFITSSPYIRELWPPWPAMFASHNVSRPLIGLSLAINFQISGLNVWSYHALNLIIHLVAALALFGIVRRTLLSDSLRERFGAKSTILAAVSSLIWTVHPLQTQSVTYIIQRCESMMGMFYLLTLYCAIRSFKSDRKRLWYSAAIAACVAGMLSKQVMVTAPLIVLLYDCLFISGSFKKALRDRLPLYGGLAASWIALVIITTISPLNETAGFAVTSITPWKYFLSEFSVIVHYIRLSVWPDALALDYGWPEAKRMSEILPYGVFLALLGAATLWALIRRKPAGFLGAWFFLILSVTSSIMPFSDLAFEHRMYLPLAAIVVLIVAGGFLLIEELFKRLPAVGQREESRRLVVVVLVTMIVTPLGFLTIQRNMTYYSPWAVWKDAIAKRPHNSRAYTNFGKLLAERGQIEEALDYFYLAYKYNPDSVPLLNNLGQALINLGEVEKGKAFIQEALRIKPNYEFAIYSLGCAYAAEGNIDEAINQFAETIRRNPRHEGAYLKAGAALEKKGKVTDAIKCYRFALQLDPDWKDALSHLARALATIDDPQVRNTNEAVSLAKRAVDITQGQDPEMLDTLAVTYAAAGLIEEAINTAQKAQALAVESGDQKSAAEIEARLNSYRAEQATVRQVPPKE